MRAVRRTWRTVGAGLVMVALLVGCGSTDGGSGANDDPGADVVRPGPDTAALPAACDLLRETDVRTALGEPVVAGPQSRDECWWSTANDLKTVNLIRRTDDVATWRSGYENDFWTPNDRGDEGYTGRALTSVVWRIGATQYEVNVVYSTRGDPEAVVETLADLALGRL